MRLAEVLRREISELTPNTALPTEHQLARRFGVSRVTVRQALDILQRGGMLSRQRGRGTMISPPKVVRSIVPIHTIEEDLRRQGLRCETRVLKYERRGDPPDFVRLALSVAGSGRVGLLALVRLVGDLVIAYDRRYFPPAIADRFRPSELGDRPVADLVSRLAGGPRARVDWDIEIVPSSQEEALALGIAPGVLVVSSITTEYQAGGAPIETAWMSYRIDRVKFRYSGQHTMTTAGARSERR